MKLIQRLNVPELKSERNLKEQARKPVLVQVDYAKVAKQVWDWSFRFDGTEDLLEFVDRVRTMPH